MDYVDFREAVSTLVEESIGEFGDTPPVLLVEGHQNSVVPLVAIGEDAWDGFIENQLPALIAELGGKRVALIFPGAAIDEREGEITRVRRCVTIVSGATGLPTPDAKVGYVEDDRTVRWEGDTPEKVEGAVPDAIVLGLSAAQGREPAGL